MVSAEAPEAEEVLYFGLRPVIVFRIPDRKGGAFCGVVAYARRMNLMFSDGARLADPYSALVGSGKKDAPHLPVKDKRHRATGTSD